MNIAVITFAAFALGIAVANLLSAVMTHRQIKKWSAEDAISTGVKEEEQA